MNTYLIVPAFSDQAGILRIVSREGRFDDALSDYRANPDAWAEAGNVTAGSGQLVCLSGPKTLWDEMKESEPLRPPATFYA